MEDIRKLRELEQNVMIAHQNFNMADTDKIDYAIININKAEKELQNYRLKLRKRLRLV